MARFLICSPWLLLIALPVIIGLCKSANAARAQREQEAAQAAAAELKRIETERKQAISQAKAAERERNKAAREAERQRKQDAKLEAARQLAEYKQAALQAERELRALRQQAIPANPAPQEQPAAPVEQPQPVASNTPVAQRETPRPKPLGNRMFVGHVVSFTGRLPGMTRREAIRAVQDNGGRAYEKMPAGTTLLVVGDKPGMCKLDKADEWIGQVRKITAAQFFDMLNEPVTIEAEEFEAMFAA